MDIDKKVLESVASPWSATSEAARTSDEIYWREMWAREVKVCDLGYHFLLDGEWESMLDWTRTESIKQFVRIRPASLVNIMLKTEPDDYQLLNGIVSLGVEYDWGPSRVTNTILYAKVVSPLAWQRVWNMLRSGVGVLYHSH